MKDRRIRRLVQKARRGNTEAFCSLIELRAKKIFFIATKMMGSKAEGEEAAQEAIIEIGKSLGTLKNPEHFDTWMYRVICNVCMKEKKKLVRLSAQCPMESEIMETAFVNTNIELSPEESTVKNYDESCIIEAIDAMPERYRLCMLMFYYEEMGYAEIAQTLSVSEQAVANLLNRGRAQLASVLAKQDVGVAAKSGGFAAAIPASVVSKSLLDVEAGMALPLSLSDIPSLVAKSELAFRIGAGGALRSSLFSKATAAVAAAGLAATCCVGAVLSTAEVRLDEPDPATPPAPLAFAEPISPVQTETTVEVVRQSDGESSTVVVEGDGEAWQDFLAKEASLSFIGSGDIGGSECRIYCEELEGLRHYYYVFDQLLGEPGTAYDAEIVVH